MQRQYAKIINQMKILEKSRGHISFYGHKNYNCISGIWSIGGIIYATINHFLVEMNTDWFFSFITTDWKRHSNTQNQLVSYNGSNEPSVSPLLNNALFWRDIFWYCFFLPHVNNNITKQNYLHHHQYHHKIKRPVE